MRGTYLNLSDSHVEEGHIVANVNDRLGANAAHCGAEATVELDDNELIEQTLDVGVGGRL